MFEAKVEFDQDLPEYGVKKGVYVNGEDNSVYAPVAMWLEALDLALQRLKNQGFNFAAVKGISCAGQQHGSV
jgi:xylulokinase